MLPEKNVIGVIGGGQLGKMLVEAGMPWNLSYVILENDQNCPASAGAKEVIVGNLYDADKIKLLASKCDVITYEIEHINSDVLLDLEAEGMRIIPSPKTLKTIQDKGLQKIFYTENKIPTAPFILAGNWNEVQEATKSFPGDCVVLKSRIGGYDGKGVQVLKKSEILEEERTPTGGWVVEEMIPDMTEYAVIVARDLAGNTRTFPAIEMYFNEKSNLVEFLFSPSHLALELEEKCKQIAGTAINAFGGPGLFAVELFVTKSGEVLVNEIAPRPHNSGHHTIEGCYTSQFEQLNRILMGYPLGNTDMVKPAAMLNLVGPDGLNGEYTLKNAEQLLNTPGVYLHLYNKTEIKPNRKMGHVTVLANNLDELLTKSKEVKKLIGFE